ncbi:response regulator [Salinimicrobium flavum]|uniref:Response regulator n=1 Tax=Salinimicrobium flavum TaxID=1737065 RepID=A0ABW5IXI8_9FLAO
MINVPLRILLVEDNEADILITKRALAELVEAPDIEEVQDLSSCRDKMINFVPDVVISDYNLPTCTGLEILDLVREIDPTTPFIFLTGTLQDEELAANTILSGASGFILKKHMNVLGEKLKPLLKKVVFNLNTKADLREQIRKNRISVNQINDYLDNLDSDNKEQRENITRIKTSLRKFNLGNEDEDYDRNP